MYVCLILAIILNNTLRKNTNPTELIMYVTDKLIRQMRNSTLELDLNYELQYMGEKPNKNTMHLTLDMYYVWQYQIYSIIHFLYFIMAHSLDLNLFKHRIINLKQWQQRSQVSLDSLTLVALLTINSFPITIPRKISGGLNVFSYLIVMNLFFLF